VTWIDSPRRSGAPADQTYCCGQHRSSDRCRRQQSGR
jgi:hypothetical protein